MTPLFSILHSLYSHTISLGFFFFSYLSRRSWWNRLGDLLICTARSTGRSWAVLPGCTTGRWSRYMRQYQSIKRWQIGILQPGKGKALGWPNCAFQYLDGILEERWRETIERDNLWGYVVTGQGGVTSDWKRIGLGEMILWRHSYGVFFFFLFFCFVEHCVLLNFFFLIIGNLGKRYKIVKNLGPKLPHCMQLKIIQHPLSWIIPQ